MQTSPVLGAWSLEEPMCPEIEYIVRAGKLRIDEGSDSHCYTAFLWGAWLHAARDAVIVFDRVDGADGEVTGVEFHFITREEFDLTYRVVG